MSGAAPIIDEDRGDRPSFAQWRGRVLLSEATIYAAGPATGHAAAAAIDRIAARIAGHIAAPADHPSETVLHPAGVAHV